MKLESPDLLEHCDLQRMAFCSSSSTPVIGRHFEKRIGARWKYGYHRGEPVAVHLQDRRDGKEPRWGFLNLPQARGVTRNAIDGLASLVLPLEWAAQKRALSLL